MRVEQAANAIDEEAAAWVARLGRGLGGDEQAALDAWLAADRRHRGALLRAQAVFAQFDRARALGPSEADPVEAPRSRRWLLRGAGTAIAASIAGVVGVALWPQAEHAEFATRAGEIRSIALADGSVVTLDAASRITVTLAGDRRAIDLLAGRALFDVAKDPARPFVVDAGALRVRALGTSFSVERRGADAAEVLMREGLVHITRGGQPGAGVRLAASERLTLAAGALTRSKIDAGGVARALGWRTGMLDFADTPLAEAAATFARYGGTRIVVAPEVARRTVTGRFAASDPRGFAQAVATSLALRLDTAPGEMILSR